MKFGPARMEELRAADALSGGVEHATVTGDRGIPSVNRARSLQSRLSNALAIGLMSALGVGMLGWYYAQAFARRSATQSEGRESVREKTKGEMVLPALGPVESPAPVSPTLLEQLMGPAPELPAEPLYEQGSDDVYVPSASVAETPAVDVELTRRLKGPVFVEVSQAARTASPAQSSDLSLGSQALESGELAPLLRPAVTQTVEAQVLPTQRLLLPKGAFVDCTLETAIDSTLPGMVTCITATDTFSADGTVVLIERGTKLVGETRGTVRQGAARIFVLWTQARTPEGVIVPLASPATDELGRAGLDGEVDRHFFERFGAAMLISVIDGVVQSAVQRSMDAATVIYNPSTSQDILTEVLRSTVNIPPTVRKQQGDRVQVLVARDLDFRTVYRLRVAEAGQPR